MTDGATPPFALSPAQRAKLEALLAREGLAAEAAAVIPPRPASAASAPLSCGQERLWFLEQVAPGTAVFNVPGPFRLEGPLDIEALRGALADLTARHEILRSTFPLEDERPRQVIAAPGPVALPLVDVSAVPAAQRFSHTLSLVNADYRRPFDLAAGPVFRAALWRLDEEDHVLLLAMHHIVSDAHTLVVLCAELEALYAARRTGTAPSLAPPELQYADYAVWQRDWLESDEVRAQFAWWKERLAGEVARLDLPLDRPRPATQTMRGAWLTRELPRRLLERLEELGRAHRATPFMVSLAAFKALLHRTTGAVDVTVGSPVGTRNRVELEGMPGFFVNTLVHRTDLSGDPPFIELLARVRDTALGAFAHQDVPFERVVDAVQPDRDLSLTPLFQVMFDHRVDLPRGLHLEGLRSGRFLVEREVHSATSKVDLALNTERNERGAFASVEYNTDLFDEVTMARTLEHLEVLMTAVVERPETKLSALPLLGVAERSLILETFNDTASEYPRDDTVHGIFARRAHETPDAVAIEYGAEAVSYAALDARGNRIARTLRNRGVRVGDRVALCVERSNELIEAMLGILKAGAAYVPLDPSYPTERLAFMLADCGAKVLVTQEALLAELPADGIPALRLDADREEIRAAGNVDSGADFGADFDAGAGPEDAVYVIYTSGSTGVPKGVAVPHRSVLRLMFGTDWLELDASVRMMHLAPVSFDASILDIWGGLLHGGCIVPFPERVPSIERLRREITEHSINSLFLTTALFNTIVDEAPEILRGVRQIATGGEAMSLPHLRRQQELLPHLRVTNCYGPTEGGVMATRWIAPRPLPDDLTSIPIGSPIANTTCYVLDARREPVPIGVPGELYLGGPGVALGYLGRPALSAERFMTNPFGTGTLYRTGDRVRWRADGNLEFLGRDDDQVKIRGHRIELGEIEATLGAHDDVRQVLAVALDDGGGAKRLVAYVVPRPGADPTPDTLGAYLREHSPEYMVPGAFIVLDAFPLTAGGKIDRRALPAPGDTDETGTADHVAPRTELERVLAEQWAQVLDLPRVGIHDDFFRIGGHSLLATVLGARIARLFGVELPLQAFFQSPTVAGLAARIERERAGDRASTLPPIARRPTADGRHPLSLNQKGLWYVQRLTPHSPFYNVPVTIPLSGPLDVGALEESLGALVRRHEALRTTFPVTNGSPEQLVGPPGPFALPVVDAVDEDDVRRRCEELGRARLDLERGPLFRALLLRRGPDAAVLAVNVHHLVFDGWSMDVFVAELTELYAALSAGKPSPLAPLPIQYADYAAWQHDWLRGEAWDRELAWWREKLDGASFMLSLPLDHPRPDVMSYGGATVRRRLPDTLAARVRALGRETGTTVYMTLLAAVQVLLRRVTGQTDFTLGTPVAGRSRSECEGAIGLYLNIVTLRANLADDPPFGELLHRVREETLAAHAHQDLPFESLVEAVQPDRDLGVTPIFQVLYSFRTPGRAVTAGGVEFQPPREIDTGTSKTDLSITVDDDGTSIVVDFTYDSALFEPRTMERWAGYLETLLDSAVAAPPQPISTLALLCPDEERRVLHDWSGPTPDYPRAASIGELFTAQTARTPDAIALVLGDEEMTYRALDERSNRLAHHLLALGVARGDRIAMALDRSFDLVVGILGILKTGAAYVPLDPSYPRERLAFMLEDTAAPVLLAHSHLLPSLPTASARVVRIDEERAAIDARPGTAPRVEVNGDDVAYVMYTSGSTGRPKGVVIPHRGPVRLVCGADYATLNQDTVLLLLAPVSFDASTLELWGSLLRGGRLVIYPERIPRAEDLDRVLKRHGVTTLWLTAALFNAIIDERPQALSGLRELLTGGEALSVPHVLRAHAELPATVQLINGYGPTENTTFTCCHRIPRDLAADVSSIPIGRPISNTKVYVVDTDLRPVPPGIPGELVIGGDGLARGYHARPELTAERFVPNPFGPGHIYRTGDLVRWRDDGILEFLGRNDDQVKIRGHRIELGEIQTVLGEHPSLRKVHIGVHVDAQAGKRLAAWVVPAPGAEIDRAALEEFLGDRLPDYMVPRAFTFLDELPVSANGKVDRAALPAPRFAAATDSAGGSAPRNEMDRHLVAIWKRTLGVEELGIHDDFFELGGHSLLAVRLLAEVNDVFGMDLPLTSLISAPTVAAQAQAIYDGVGSLESTPLVKIRPDGDRPPVFCVCSLGGTVLNQRPLAMRLGEGQPFYGLQAIHLDEVLGRPATIEDYARRYLEAIREVWPDGPYIVGGHSFGGVVSYEIAQQLQAAGAEVAMLFILDSALPNLGPSTLADRLGGFTAFLRGLPHVPGELVARFRRDPAQFRLAARQKLHFARRRFARSTPPPASPASPASSASSASSGVETPAALAGLSAEDIVEMSHWPERNREIARRHWRAVLAYEPTPYPGVVTLFRSRLQSPLLALGLRMGWDRVARAGVEVLTVPGSHLSILDPPHVDVLARKFRRRLAK